MFEVLDGEFNAIGCSHSFQPISAKEEKTKCFAAKNNIFVFFLHAAAVLCFGFLPVPSALDLPRQAEGGCNLMAGYLRAMHTFGSSGSISHVISSG